ncbi:MAG: helix-turn-helix transcriptional regulator [Clostridia bacterium]|nr:helix-turn-helix transcriptional regulator [Clostridia bacterium]
MSNKFSYNLKKLRVERGLSQKQLAEVLQTTLKTISHWETGYTEPSIDLILRISTYFDISTDELLGKE